MRSVLLLLFLVSCDDCDKDVFDCNYAKNSCQEQLDRTSNNGFSTSISNSEVIACSEASEACSK